MELSCDGNATNVELSDDYGYANQCVSCNWMVNNEYVFLAQNEYGMHALPISVRITRKNDGNDDVIHGCNIITDWNESSQFKFRSNF